MLYIYINMNRDELLKYLYDIGLVQGYCRKLANSSDWNIIEDIVQEIWLQICEVPEEKWSKLLSQGTKSDSFKAVRGYISGLIYRNVKSENSRVFNKLKKHQKKEVLTDSGFITDEEFGEYAIEEGLQ